MRITLLLISYAFLVSLAILVEAWPAGPQRQGSTGLSVTVRPEAKMIVEEADPPVLENPSQTISWFRVGLAVRVHSGATAALFLERAPGASKTQRPGFPAVTCFIQMPESTSPTRWNITRSQPLLTVPKNGLYSLLVGIGIDDHAAEDEFSVDSIRFILKSSDGILHVTKTVPLKRGIRGNTPPESRTHELAREP